MDILNKALGIIERTTELEAEGDFDCLQDEEKLQILGEGAKRFQNENVYNRLLPYDVTEQSQEHLMRIKASLAKCIQLDQETVYEWFIDLERFVDLYGLAFSKEDHIYFVKLQYELIISKKNMDLYYIAYVARCFSRLMQKRYLISSDELVLDWRPLYETYERLLFSETENLGLRFVPENLESNLSQAIRLARPHFPIEATHEMLDEWRPMLCPFSVSMQRAVTYLNLFLPTTLPPEHHDKGFRLWFDEVMHFWLSGKVSVTTYESKFTLLLSRLSADCLGFIDWEPYIPKIFNQFKSSLNLNGGVSKGTFRRSNESVDVGPCVQWMVYMINKDNSCLDHISKLFKAIESFYHPSNTDRRWHSRLQQFLYKLPACYVKRLYRERFKKDLWSKRLPESHKLTEEQTTKFVDALMPVVLTSMFNQAGISSAALAFRDLSVLRPERVIPPLLDRLYGSYETLTEPHRLLASINCMASVVPAMVRPCKYFPQGPTHVVPLLLNSLPGIDSNDMRKCIAVFRFIATLAAHIRMKNYSYLIDDRDNLTFEQQQLCLATAQFEDFVIQFLDKCFILIENTATATFSNLDNETHSKNGEEGIIEAAISSVTLSILAQASDEIKMAALDKLYYHVTSHIFDTKTQGKAIATLCLACAKSTPKETLAKFIPHFARLILTLTEHEEVFKDSLLDDELLFSLLLLSEIVRCNSPYLLDYKDLIVEVLHRALKLTAKEGYLLGCAIIRHLLRALTNIACCDWRNIDLDNEQNKATEERWPFDNWGHTTHHKDLNLKWEIPGPEARQFAQELLQTFMQHSVHCLIDWTKGEKHLSKDEIQRSLHVILSSLVGSASVLPSLISPTINLCRYEVDVVPMCVKNTGTEPLNLNDGTNIRTWVVTSLMKILSHLRITSEDDTKSLTLVCEILGTAISYFGYNKTELRIAAQRIKSMKSGTQNKLLGSNRYLRYLLVERVAQQHRAMLLNKGQPEFTQLHLDVFKCLFDLAQSHYVEVRILAQDTVYLMLNYFPFLEAVLVPMLVSELKKPDIEHKKFKGLLYLVVGRRSYSSIMIDPNWSYLRQLWPAIVESPHSEKPSIVKLLDRLCNLVQKGFDTFELQYKFSDKVKEIAVGIWNSESIDLGLYQPPDEEFKKKTALAVAQRNELRISDYQQLVLQLCHLIEDPHLHWHRRLVAYSLFTHLMRDDCIIPLPALNCCLSSLISERLSIRTKAIQLVVAQLKLHKRSHKKRLLVLPDTEEQKHHQSTMIEEMEVDTASISLNDQKQTQKLHKEGNSQSSGLNDCNISRNSNKWMQYKLSEGNYSKEEWDKLVFIDKPHIGFYDWPKVLEVYEPYEQQPKLNRSEEELNEYELSIYRKFNNPDFIEQLVKYFCFEDNKGSPETIHRLIRPGLFKGLFRNFGPCMLEPFKKYILEYSTSTCEQKQKFVIEFLAGLLRGSKHWSWEMMNDLKLFVLPLLDQMTVTQENFNDWTGLVSFVFRHRDIKRFEWLMHYFVTKAISQSESTSPTITPFIQASRLTLAHCSLVQCEWRAVDHVFPVVIQHLRPQDHLLAYANVRTCLASIYSLIYMFDDPFALTRIPGTLANGPKREEFINFLLPRLAILEKSKQSLAHLSVAPDDLASGLQHHHQVTEVVAAKLANRRNSGVRVSGSVDSGGTVVEDTLMAVDEKSRFISELQAAAAESLPAGASDETDVVLFAETLMKLRQMDTQPGSPSSSVGGVEGIARHHHNLVEAVRQHASKHASSIGEASGGRGIGGGGSSSSSVSRLIAEAKALGQKGVASGGSGSADGSPGTSMASSFVDNLRQALPSLNIPTAAASQSDGSSSTDSESQERKDAIKLMKLTSFWIIYNVCRLRSPVPADFFKLLPVICEMGRENNDPELAADSLAAVAILGGSALSLEAVVESLKCVRKIIAEHSWHARVAAAAFIEIIVSSNLFKLLSSSELRKEIEDIVINYLIRDERIEVRESSSLTLGGMIHCEFTKLTPDLLNEFKRRASEPLVKRSQANGTTVIDSKSTVKRHSGILCLCACVDANPYTVPDYLPGILTLLCEHLTDPQPISTTIKKTMSNFRRTHHDNWQSDKTKFTDDQLCVLADLLVSPSYYA